MLLSPPASGRALAAALFLASLAACESDRGARYGRTAPDAKTTPSAPTPELEAHGEFFAGQIETEVLLGRAGFGPRVATDGSASSSGERQGRGGGGFSGSGRRGGGMGGGRGGMGGGRGGETAGARGGGRKSDDGEPVPQIRASNAAPVQLHLRLTNLGTEPIEIEVTDFNSDLGNFVVQPRKLSIPAGGSVEAEPMTSRLGVNSTEIPLTVVIRANGRSEKQVLFLRVKAPAPPAATSAPTPPVAPP